LLCLFFLDFCKFCCKGKIIFVTMQVK
jgi:hypothetical protein